MGEGDELDHHTSQTAEKSVVTALSEGSQQSVGPSRQHYMLDRLEA